MRSLIYLEEERCRMCRLRGSGAHSEQKRKIAERITGCPNRDGRAKRENIHVSFHDVSPSNYGGSRHPSRRPEAHAMKQRA